MGGLILLGGGQVRRFVPGQGVFHLEHEQPLLHPAAEVDHRVFAFLRGLHGVVQGIAQQGAQVGVGEQQPGGKGHLEDPPQPPPLHLLGLGGEDHVGCLVVAKAPLGGQGRGADQLVQIGLRPPALPLGQKALEGGDVVAQVVAKGAQLLVLPLLRGRICARTCALLWVIPPTVYQQLMEASAPLANFTSQLLLKEITPDDVNMIKTPVDFENLNKLAVAYSDGVIQNSETVNTNVTDYARSLNIPVLDYQQPDKLADACDAFYDRILAGTENK